MTGYIHTDGIIIPFEHCNRIQEKNINVTVVFRQYGFSCSLRPRPHQSLFKRKRNCFAPDTAIVHTATPKTIIENGAIRKRSPDWSDFKTMLFENAVF